MSGLSVSIVESQLRTRERVLTIEAAARDFLLCAVKRAVIFMFPATKATLSGGLWDLKGAYSRTGVPIGAPNPL